MAVTLTSSDLAHLGDAVRLLVSPFDHDGVDGWRSAVLAHLRPLLGADSAGFLLPVPGQLPFYSNEQDLGELNTYPDVPPPPDVNGVPGLVKSAELGVATLAMAYEGDPSEYFASAHYNEHAAPHHSHDTLMMTAVGPEVAGLSSLHFWHDRPTGPTFGDREVALLRVLRPAFMAGIRSTVAWTRHRKSLLDAFDRLGQAAAVADMDGRLLHVTPALEQMLDDDPDPVPLRAALRDLLGGAVRAERGDGAGAAFERSVRTRSAAYALRGCLYGGHVGTPLAIVNVERAHAAPSVDALVARFGLTERQAEVALLLGARKSNREIAEALFISPHTARNHTEAVLRKLHLRDRRDVQAKLAEPDC
ncbi:helix-turn-helix transcriptional regulator [Rubrivirga marina]|uniref:HTH luxR-type domain-containing protein n=1 Tax=Rubrivirga marina TaxID=1196024 RepID=A0A271IX11_9BACT|nr:helix-turn-helix transcriptional regulator [Rubrivirga marina]PAP75478.1 hypothetical protein BSZ37_02960 [Rubrivirga marina]